MENLVFENVVFNNPTKGKEQYFKCAGVGNAVATGNTNPVPSCFKDLTQGWGDGSGIQAFKSVPELNTSFSLYIDLKF